MSGDVQPRKRKEKRRKKDSEDVPTSFTSDEQLHVHKDASTGGNICAKILFFLLSFVLLVMIGLVVFEYRGSTDDETLVPVSKWAPTFDGWLETPIKHDEHADVTESGELEHGESGEHETESAEGEERVSEEAESKEEDDEDGGGGGGEEEEEEDDDEEEKGSEEEEMKSGEDEDEEADKIEDEESEEVDENEIEDRDEDEEEEEEEEEGSEEDVYEHGKSEEDTEAEKEDSDDDDDDDGEEEDEEEDAEDGREELDDDDEEREMPAYQRESDEIDDLLSEIPGITESDEDEEGDNLGRSDEIINKQQKIPGVNEKKIKSVSEEEVEVPRRKQEKEVGGEMKSGKTSQDKTVEEEEEGEDEPEPSGVALKFGVGVALVIVAHVVLVKKWNSDENLAAPDTSDSPQSVPQVEQQQISKQIPQILVEPETEKDSEESSYLSSEYITRRQTLLPDDLVHSSPQRELEESESSVPSEEESDDGQEEFIFKQNVYKAENAFKASHREEKPFSEEKPYKQQSFEELMKKYHERTPEGSDIESDEDEQEEEEEEEEDDERDIDDDDDELIDDEDELDNEEPEYEEEISKNKGQGSKISTTPDTEGTSPRKFVVDTQKEPRITSVEQNIGNREEDKILAGGKEDEEHEEEDAGELDSEDDSFGEKFKHYQLPKTKKLQREDEDSGSDKEIPVTKSKIPKNMGGQNAQIYSKADITNEDDWHIIQELDRADDDAEEDLNF